MKYVIGLIFILICSYSFSQTEAPDVYAYLELKNKKLKRIEVGNTYEFKLEIVNFDITQINKQMIESKSIVDFFYVLNVSNIKVSPNNADVITIDLDLILKKKFGPQKLYVWQLVDRNIPLQIRGLPDVVGDNVEGESFIYSKIKEYNNSKGIYFYLILVLIAIVSITFALTIFKKNKKKSIEVDHILLLKNSKNKNDLENVYKYRREIRVQLVSGKIKSDFDSFIELYENEQFSKRWQEKDIEDLIKAKNDILKRMTNGV